MYDSVIVGGGPAGASCALWLKQLGLEPCILEKGSTLGGLQNSSPYINKWIAVSRGKSGQDIAKDIHANVIEHGVHCRFNNSVNEINRCPGGFSVRTENGTAVTAKTLVLASGVKAARAGLISAPDVFFGPGDKVHDLPVKGKSIAILGGGDNALENYLFAKQKGVARAKIFARTIVGRRALLNQIDRADLFIGDCKFDPFTKSVNGQCFDYALVMYGWVPALGYARTLGLSVDSRGFVQVDDSCHTSIAGVYAVGEVTQRMHPCCATAMADGVVAAKAIQSMFDYSYTNYGSAISSFAS
jgi:thioredoxin reductase (NADPH)